MMDITVRVDRELFDVLNQGVVRSVPIGVHPIVRGDHLRIECENRYCAMTVTHVSEGRAHLIFGWVAVA